MGIAEDATNGTQALLVLLEECKSDKQRFDVASVLYDLFGFCTEDQQHSEFPDWWMALASSYLAPANGGGVVQTIMRKLREQLAKEALDAPPAVG